MSILYGTDVTLIPSLELPALIDSNPPVSSFGFRHFPTSGLNT